MTVAQSRPQTPQPQAIAVLGTGSDVGKSLIATALCRLWRRMGRRVAPFKAQNMSNNSFVTLEGGEIGRAQAVQAWACGREPSVHMNPILLKPESDRRSQVVIQGHAVTAVDAADYYRDQAPLWKAITDSYARICAEADAVVIEGAGSAAEVNLMARDLVNWRMADHADAKVVLVADIDRGGVFAQVLGTLDLLPPDARARVAGIVINKFRGDASLFTEGVRFIEARGRVPVLGVVPYLRLHGLDQEDSLDRGGMEPRAFAPTSVNIAVVLLPRMSNFTDFNRLAEAPDVALRYVERPAEAAGADAILIPGTKNTLADLRSLRERGWQTTLATHVERGGELVGLCGGYQILGRSIADPDRLEEGGAADGLGLLDVVTTLRAPKVSRQISGTVVGLDMDGDCVIRGYEIHMGRPIRETMAPCFAVHDPSVSPGEASKTTETEGTVAPGGRVWGSSIHGLFDTEPFRTSWLNRLRLRKGLPPTSPPSDDDVQAQREAALDRWADHVAAYLTLEPLLGR